MLNELEKKLCNCFGSTGLKLSFIENNNFGDVTTNIAMINAKKEGVSPVELAEKYIEIFKGDTNLTNIFEKIMVAGPGFINFTFTDEFLKNNLKIKLSIIKENVKIKNENSFDENLNNKNVLVEYTDPNPFKVFHIGHLMTNIIGEFVARAYGARGAKVKRINYQGDVGRHIAISIYGILKSIESNKTEWENIQKELDVKKKVEWLGQKYAKGYKDFDNDEHREDGLEKKVVSEVAGINKKIYEQDSILINEIYALGRAWSLEYFETLYKILGTTFDKYIFESEATPIGLEIVKNNIQNNIFEVGDEGAIIFDGEKEGLHKRVFINKNGLPTYEAKDLGNFSIKAEAYPEAGLSIVITGSEQNDYFKVLNKSIEKLVKAESFGKIKGIENRNYGHGMMRFADGKMSSRKGNVIAGDELIEIVKESLKEKFEKSRVEDTGEREFLIEKVAIAAIKYAVLKQSIGKDVIFDIEKAISVDGDSGPYLQYTHARISGILDKEENKLGSDFDINNLEINQNNKNLIINLLKYENTLKEVISEIAPQKILTYLINLTHSFNAFYNLEKIEGNKSNIFLASKVREILKDGLDLVGIYAPSKM